jgi:hypothetical protein
MAGLVFDLRKDYHEIGARITAGISSFCPSATAATYKPITRIDIKFDLESAADGNPCVWAYLDTEPNGEPDSGTSETYDIMRQRAYRGWSAPCNAAHNGIAVMVISPSGKKVVDNNDAFREAVGWFFVDLLKSLRDQGAFKFLRCASHCYLGVDGDTGEFGWPCYEDRGPDNML